ncbi:MAG: VCBS repeat-containing protein, partial [Eudoraea sp.]|nr:VCBS repeat-containing protein [Eudoraea sp.]
GIDMADINNDGNAEIFITDMLPEKDQRVKAVMEFEGYDVFKLKQSKDFYQQYIQNTLQLNNGNGTFSEIAYYSGVDATDWSWAGLIFDMDNDGLRDIYVTNGINHDLTDLDFVDFFANEIIQKMALTGRKESIDSIINKMPVKPQPNFAFKNNGDITFSNANKEWGFELPSMSNGAAYGDLDNDGDLEVVVNNVNMEAFIYKNNTSEELNRNFIKLKFEGSDKNKFAIGSTALLYYDNRVVMQELVPFRGFQSSMDYVMTIGMGAYDKIDSIRIIWPDDRTQKLTNVGVNQLLELKISDADETYVPQNNSTVKTLFKEIEAGQLMAHDENNYNDFDNEGLIHKLLSQEGPALAVGDIDSDGNEDVFLGGAKGIFGVVYRHLGNGKLSPLKQNDLEMDAIYEDTAAAFFDADGDGDQDLMVGSGGNERGNEQSYRARLYFNDGKGNFSKSKEALPSAFKNISTITPHDFDADGDEDVFIGSRSVVGTYGIDPNHLFLENQGDGTFLDATERLAYDLKDAGMITKAIWDDMDGDNKKDLVTISEWGTPKIFKNSGRRLSHLSTGLDSLHGWWNAIETADLDKDGDMDIVLGNEGNNLHYKPTAQGPMKLWVNDFDNNGSIEQIVTIGDGGKDYPIHQKRELTEQLVSLKKQNLKASEYSRKSIDELFPPEIFKKSIVKKAGISSSVIAINEGGGKFTIKELPWRVQLSCICGISCTDFNQDGHLDLIMGGNNFEFKPQFSRLDASFGSVLLGDGNMGFEWQDYNTSGFFIRDEIKHIETFADKQGKKYFFAAINDGKPKIFTLNE